MFPSATTILIRLLSDDNIRLFLFQTMLGSGPVPVPFNFDRPERPIVLPTPLPDFATSRGFAVGCGEIDAWLVGATWKELAAFGELCQAVIPLSPAFEGADTAVFARKCFVTDTDLKDVGFLVMDLVPSFPARLVSVSEPPLVSAADCVPARSSKEGRGDAVPLTVGSLEASEGAAAAGCFCVPSVAGWVRVSKRQRACPGHRSLPGPSSHRSDREEVSCLAGAHWGS